VRQRWNVDDVEDVWCPLRSLVAATACLAAEAGKVVNTEQPAAFVRLGALTDSHNDVLGSLLSIIGPTVALTAPAGPGAPRAAPLLFGKPALFVSQKHVGHAVHVHNLTKQGLPRCCDAGMRLLADAAVLEVLGERGTLKAGVLPQAEPQLGRLLHAVLDNPPLSLLLVQRLEAFPTQALCL
jgi:hypothetical protein